MIQEEKKVFRQWLLSPIQSLLDWAVIWLCGQFLFDGVASVIFDLFPILFLPMSFFPLLKNWKRDRMVYRLSRDRTIRARELDRIRDENRKLLGGPGEAMRDTLCPHCRAPALAICRYNLWSTRCVEGHQVDNVSGDELSPWDGGRPAIRNDPGES